MYLYSKYYLLITTCIFLSAFQGCSCAVQNRDITNINQITIKIDPAREGGSGRCDIYSPESLSNFASIFSTGISNIPNDVRLDKLNGPELSKHIVPVICEITLNDGEIRKYDASLVVYPENSYLEIYTNQEIGWQGDEEISMSLNEVFSKDELEQLNNVFRSALSENFVPHKP